jgi:flagellar hook assembly protein FlgD
MKTMKVIVLGAALSMLGLGSSAAWALDQNHPNPFNSQTTISFTLAEAQGVSLRIYDLKGAVVRTLLDGSVLPADSHDAVWDGRDDGGLDVAAGVYFYRLEAGGADVTKKMTLLE